MLCFLPTHRQGHEAGIRRNIWSSDSDLPLSSSWSPIQVLTQPWQQDMTQPLQYLLVLGISKGLARGLIPRQSSVHYESSASSRTQVLQGKLPGHSLQGKAISATPDCINRGSTSAASTPKPDAKSCCRDVSTTPLCLETASLLPCSCRTPLSGTGRRPVPPLCAHIFCVLTFPWEKASCSDTKQNFDLVRVFATWMQKPARAPAGWPSLTPTICQDWLASPAPPNWVQEDVAVGNVWGKAAALWNWRSHRQLSRSDKQELVMWDRSPTAQTV